MDMATFRLHFPEFKETDPALIVAKLQAAAARMGGPDVFIWGGFAQPGQLPTIADIAQGNLAAHYLVTSPFGTEMRAAGGEGEKRTDYLAVFEDHMISVAGGFAVAGAIV